MPALVFHEIGAQDRTERGRERRRDGDEGRRDRASIPRERPKDHGDPDRGEHPAADALEEPERDKGIEAPARPAPSDATLKMASASMKVRLEPKRSARKPATGIKTARPNK